MANTALEATRSIFDGADEDGFEDHVADGDLGEPDDAPPRGHLEV